MDIRSILWESARSARRSALPILSFPAVQKMNAKVCDLVRSAELQARAMELVARTTPTLAAVSLMDLSVEAEAFGAQVRFSENEVPAVVGQLVSDKEEARALCVPTPGAGRTGVCAEGIRLAKRRICDKPVLAGMIGPFSLAIPHCIWPKPARRGSRRHRNGRAAGGRAQPRHGRGILRSLCPAHR